MKKTYKQIVLNVPHSSIEGLIDSGWPLTFDFFEKVRELTDWFTDFLFKSALPQVKMIRSDLSRFVVDMERLYNDPLEAIGQGIVYTNYDGFKRTINDTEYSRLINCYDRHIQKLKSVLTPESILIDCHSFPSFQSEDIDICIGYNDDWSRPDDSTLSFVAQCFDSRGFKVAFNSPYSNSISPTCDFSYHSLMIELNKKTYMDQQTLRLTEGCDVIKGCIAEIYNALLNP